MKTVASDPLRLLARSPLQRQRVRVIEQFVYDQLRQGRASPTIREIAAHLAISVSSAHNSVGYALASGRLVHDPEIPRSLRPRASLRFEIDVFELTRELLTDQQRQALSTSGERSRALVAERMQLGGQVGWSAVVAAMCVATLEVARELAPVH